MLVKAIAGRPLEHGLTSIHQSGPLSIAQALHRKGMLHLLTDAGRSATTAEQSLESANSTTSR